MPQSLPDYRNLDLSGEAAAAAGRMEARAQEPSSLVMFETLVRPLLVDVGAVLEVGCGTASLARRIAAAAPTARICASDKSNTMLAVAGRLAAAEGLSRIELKPWDVTREGEFPFGSGPFDLIISSVLTIYLSDQEVVDLVRRLVKQLAGGGVLAFVEQDLMTDSSDDTSGLFLKVQQKDARILKPTQGLGLRRVLKDAGLDLLPLASHVWTDEQYGPYTRELLERFSDAAVTRGMISASEALAFKDLLNARAASRDFYYGLVYHRIAGRVRGA